MKKKITISLDENILQQIDASVTKGTEKNRSYVIEKILSEKYGDANNISVIIFAHDIKWDNRSYPFSTPKSLLGIQKRPLLVQQIEMFQKYSINSFSISIPNGTTLAFQDTISKYFPDLTVRYIEVDSETKTGDTLRKILQSGDFCDNIIISNGDIYYGDLSIENYYKYHKAQKGDFSFALKFVMNPEQLGNVAIDGNKILEFVEKPKARASYLTSCGMYITTIKFLKSHDLGEHLEDDFFPKLPTLGNTIGFIYSGQWEHIQNDSAYERADGQLL